MTPAARYAAAIEVLDTWQAGEAAEAALTRWARGARYAGSKDRAAVRDHVYDVLRRAESCAALGGGRDGRALVLGLLRLAGTDPASVFTGEGHAPSPLRPAEMEAPGGVPDPETDIPAWVRDALAERAGDSAAAAQLYASLGARAPVWLRVNLRRVGRDEAARSLAEDDIPTRPHPGCGTALEVTGPTRALRRSKAFLFGWVEPQDLSVQMAVDRVDWPQTGHILDYCSGGGGKTLAIADRSDAALFAHDAQPSRMAGLAERADRADVRYRELASEGLQQHAPYDLVLADVPCSGSGTWRRDPEAKWRLTPARLSKLVATQDAILDAAGALVATGGQLVYMTCSLLADENEARIDAFLGRSAGWRCEDQSCFTPLSASDGFFSACLRRVA